MPRQYKFKYSYYKNLPSGKRFKRIGEIVGFSVSDCKKRLPEDAVVKPIINSLCGADAVFYTTIDKASKEDKPN